MTAGSDLESLTGQKRSGFARFGSLVAARSCCWRRRWSRAGAIPAAPQSATAAGPDRRRGSILARAWRNLTSRAPSVNPSHLERASCHAPGNAVSQPVSGGNDCGFLRGEGEAQSGDLMFGQIAGLHHAVCHVLGGTARCVGHVVDHIGGASGHRRQAKLLQLRDQPVQHKHQPVRRCRAPRQERALSRDWGSKVSAQTNSPRVLAVAPHHFKQLDQVGPMRPGSSFDLTQENVEVDLLVGLS
eukprot:3083243-Amphidinium_carterae.1